MHGQLSIRLALELVSVKFDQNCVPQCNFLKEETGSYFEAGKLHIILARGRRHIEPAYLLFIIIIIHKVKLLIIGS